MKYLDYLIMKRQVYYQILHKVKHIFIILCFNVCLLIVISCNEATSLFVTFNFKVNYG